MLCNKYFSNGCENVFLVNKWNEFSLLFELVKVSHKSGFDVSYVTDWSDSKNSQQVIDIERLWVFFGSFKRRKINLRDSNLTKAWEKLGKKSFKLGFVINWSFKLDFRMQVMFLSLIYSTSFIFKFDFQSSVTRFQETSQRFLENASPHIKNIKIIVKASENNT